MNAQHQSKYNFQVFMCSKVLNGFIQTVKTTLTGIVLINLNLDG